MVACTTIAYETDKKILYISVPHTVTIVGHGFSRHIWVAIAVLSANAPVQHMGAS